ncbi:MAG TPA: CAP domain-containing protein [Candidatus Nanoarchaeia archaeon]|nr:CAP domain-containing protein [Candidatus Nanoarchaeia archaeon]
MLNSKKSPISPVSGFIWMKSRQSFCAISLFAVVLGIFLLPKTALMASITSERIIILTNEERTRDGLNPLAVNDELTKAANAKAQAILTAQTFDHTIGGRKFSSWIKDAGYQYILAGENLAIDFVTAEAVMRAWMNSPDHRANILRDEYADIGVGVAEGKFAGQNTIVVAQLFGDPLIKSAPIPQSISRLNERIIPWENNNYPADNYLSYCRQFLNRFSLLAERRVALF